jgi:ATP-dependent RNA helicase DeaD
MFRNRHARATAGTPEAILTLLQASALKLDQVKTVVLAWTDDATDAAFASALEAVMVETPKDAARVLIASRLTPEVEAIAERYVRRARRVVEPAESEARPTPLHYVTVSSASRADSVRRVLDTLDPLKAALFVRSAETEDEVQRILRALGYAAGDDAITVVRGATPSDATLIVLYDLPGSKAELRTIVGATLSGKQVVALARPRQLALLRDLAAGGGINPLPLPGAVNDARHREESMRNQLRTLLAEGAPARELLALEPLLAEYDGIEIAAAALKLLDRARERSSSAVARPEKSAPATAGAWTNIFVTVGARDSVQPGDLVGAILNESGIAREHVGKVDIRDGFSLVQIATADVTTVVNALNGKSVKGRSVVARLERDPGADRGGEGRPRSAGRDRDSGGRGAPRRDRPPARGFPPRGDAPGRDRGRPGRDSR